MTEVRVENIREAARSLRAGERVLLSGTVYTARDAAHALIFELLDSGGALPFELMDAVIYYTGPTPAPTGRAVGSCGPTTSGRMDKFTPRLYDLGLAATIGKGERSQQVRDAIVRNGAVYLCAVGGAGALMAACVKAAREIAFPELGCESVKALELSHLPLTVAIDCHGGNLFIDGPREYLEKKEETT